MRRHHAAREVAVALAVLLALVARPDSVLATGDTARIENAGAAKENASPAPSGETHRTAPVALPKPVSLQTTTDPFRSSTVQLTEGRLSHTWQNAKAGVLADMARLALCRVK